MREHKYRAWDKKEKRWLGVNLHMSVTDGTLWWQFGIGCSILSAEERKNIELLQYTGLKDKNGKEIYEGDILKFKLNTRYGYIEKTGVIKCESLASGCTINFLPLQIDGLQFGYLVIEPEIIGNIYNNPELVGADK